MTFVNPAVATPPVLNRAAGLVNVVPSVDHSIPEKVDGLVDDVITQPFEIRRGRLSVPEAPGLGIQVDLAKVRKYQVGASC